MVREVISFVSLFGQWATAAATAATPAAARADNGFDWPQIEQRIADHRQHVRLCGPLSAARALRLLGHPLDVRALVSSFQEGDPRGISLQSVVTICRQYEPTSRAVSVSPADIASLPLPCILVVNQRQHCIVLQRLLSNSATAEIWDPSDGRTKQLAVSALHDIWDGDAVALTDVGHQERRLWIGNIGIVVLVVTIWTCRNWPRRHRECTRRDADRECQED